MDRRDAIKNISLSLGFPLATPMLLSILNACSKDNANNKWTPVFLSDVQQHIINNLVDIILPKSNSLGGVELNIVQFIDKMIAYTLTKKEQQLFSRGSIEFENKFGHIYKKTAVKGSKKEYSDLLATSFKVSKEKEKLVFAQLELDEAQVPKHSIPDFLIYKFLTSVRYYSLFGYYTSQLIMEEELNYNPNLGYYKGCENL